MNTLFHDIYYYFQSTFDQMKRQLLISKFTSVILLLTNIINVFSQDVEYYTKEYFRFENHVYKDNIHTVQLNIDGNILSPDYQSWRK